MDSLARSSTRPTAAHEARRQRQFTHTINSELERGPGDASRGRSREQQRRWARSVAVNSAELAPTQPAALRNQRMLVAAWLSLGRASWRRQRSLGSRPSTMYPFQCIHSNVSISMYPFRVGLSHAVEAALCDLSLSRTPLRSQLQLLLLLLLLCRRLSVGVEFCAYASVCKLEAMRINISVSWFRLLLAHPSPIADNQMAR